MEEQQPEGEQNEQGETWEQMASRVTAEEINGRYAKQLADSFKAYMEAGFTYDQAWKLTRDEHRSRLEFMGNSAIITLEQGDTP